MESLGTQCTHVASSLEVHIPAGQIGATSCAAAVTKKRRPCRAHSERLPKTGPAPTRALHPDFDSYRLSSYRRRRSFHLKVGTKVEAQSNFVARGYGHHIVAGGQISTVPGRASLESHRINSKRPQVAQAAVPW